MIKYLLQSHICWRTGFLVLGFLVSFKLAGIRKDATISLFREGEGNLRLAGYRLVLFLRPV